ncbi:MAG: hypothetical protein WKH64_15020 [Chloroflexia bacterium]
MLGRVLPEETRRRVGKRVAAVERVGADESAESLFEVVRDVRLRRPLVAVCGESAAHVRVVEERELPRELVVVRRDLAAEHRKARVALAAWLVPEKLIVRAVLLDDVEDVLDSGGIADLHRYGLRRLRLRVGLPYRRLDPRPVVVVVDLRGVALHLVARWEGNDRGACCVL